MAGVDRIIFLLIDVGWAVCPKKAATSEPASDFSPPPSQLLLPEDPTPPSSTTASSRHLPPIVCDGEHLFVAPVIYDSRRPKLAFVSAWRFGWPSTIHRLTLHPIPYVS